MHYVLHYGQIAPALPYLIGGALISLELSILAFAGGMVIGLALAIARNDGGPILSRLVRAYVAFFTNTPQLVQIYVIFFGLPDFGVLFSPFAAVLLGMTLNAAAYLTEILRAGLASVRPQELDAAETLGMSRLQALRHVVLPHLFRVAMPPLTNQYILMTLGTSMAAVFGVEELTGRAFNLNATTFRSIEIFTTVAGLYVVVTFAATLLLAVVGRFAFRAPRAGALMLSDIVGQIPQVFTRYNLLLLGEAALTTLLLSAVGCLVGLVLGFALSLARLSRTRWLAPLKVFAFLYVELLRRVPFLVTLLLFFFGAQVLGFDLAPLTVALISTSVISTAFVAEIIRGGLAAVRKSQLEAAAVMNFSPWQALALVRLPQAWPLILPPVFGYFVLFIKDTALASQVGVLELTQAGKILNTKGFSAFLVFGTVLLLYFVVSYPMARLGVYLESRLGAPRHSRPGRALR